MDINLEKYRFGITLELEPGAYQFGTDTETPTFISTTCKYAPLYLLNQGVTLRPVKKNTYICTDVTSKNDIRSLLEDYWFAVQYECQEF